MVIGLGPEYNYDVTNHKIWSKENTKYASNHGASFISRTLIDFFDADYIDDLSRVDEYRLKYDLCVIAFATHITNWRDVSKYAHFVKKLQIKTVAFSLGIQDYSGSSSKVNKIHHSLKELLDYVIESSGCVGVRGPHTASVLIKSGYMAEKIVTIGCPTIYSSLDKNLMLHKKDGFKKPLIVFHRTMADLNKDLISGAPLLGQDFLDEVVFRNDIAEDQPIRISEIEQYNKHLNGSFTLKKIKENGKFFSTFDEWFQEIKKHDFVVGARLHGCLAAISQGIPAVMLARDIRVQEIAEFYKIPYIKYQDVGELTIEEIYEKADFSQFNKLYPHRFENFIKLMDELNIKDNLTFHEESPKEYWYSKEDLNANVSILYKEMAALAIKVENLEKETSIKVKKIDKKLEKLITKMKKIPGYKQISKLFK